MTAQELQEARDLVDDMEKCVAARHYFEIHTEDTRLLAQYIRELEQRVTRDTPAK